MAENTKPNIVWHENATIIVLGLYREYFSKEVWSNGNHQHPNKPIWVRYNKLIRGLPNDEGIYINKNIDIEKLGIEVRYKKFYFLNPLDSRKSYGGPTPLDKKVWNKFKSEFTEEKIKQRGRLEKEAERIIASSENSRGNKDSGEKIEYDIYGSRKEGNKVSRLQETRERDPGISRKKKQQVLKGKGFLACEACSFIFKDFYGKHGEDFIECHHTKPVAKMEHNDVTSLSDLALVCSNCHRMIHKQDPAITIDELRAIIAENK